MRSSTNGQRRGQRAGTQQHPRCHCDLLNGEIAGDLPDRSVSAELTRGAEMHGVVEDPMQSWRTDIAASSPRRSRWAPET